VSAVPLADAPALRRFAVRTRVLRLVLALLLVALVVVSVLAGRSPRAAATPFLPPGSTGLAVLDLSASINADTYSQIGATLDRLASSGGRYGLIVFSSDAYEALPPGTPARELRPIARFFRARSAGAGFAPEFPVNPWTEFFSEGTAISRGLDLAREIAAEDRLQHPAIVLISDLDDDPGDLRRVAGSALALRRAHMPVRVVGLNPSAADAKLFARLFPGTGTIQSAPAPGARVTAPHAPAPTWLIASALFVALLLGAGELLAPVLTVSAEGRS
jgi:hypothetical protein